MAHWIIEDKGFGGVIYRCSNCRTAWDDYYHKHRKDICNWCGEDINEDENEYIDEVNEKRNRVIEVVNKENLYYCPTCKRIIDLIDIDWAMNTPNDIVDYCTKCGSEVLDLENAKQIKIYF